MFVCVNLDIIFLKGQHYEYLKTLPLERNLCQSCRHNYTCDNDHGTINKCNFISRTRFSVKYTYFVDLCLYCSFQHYPKALKRKAPTANFNSIIHRRNMY